MRRLILPVALLASSAARADDAWDVAGFKDKLNVAQDGKGHYLAFVPGSISDDEGPLFYGDGKTFYAQSLIGGGSDDKSWEVMFWEPRVNAPYKGRVEKKDGKLIVHCSDRATELSVLGKAEAQPVIAGAAWKKPRWTRQGYALARDDAGTYFYVDRAREPEDNKDFRVFRGKKGALKQQKMVNIVSDSEGDVFVTQTGKLRLVLSKNESVWVEGKKKQTLITLPLLDNRALIYTDLGVYTGQPIGTPCDDL